MGTRRQSLKRPRPWTDEELDRLIENLEDDVDEVIAAWRKFAPPAWRPLLDAEPDDGEV